jgi:hypothetical protein
VAFAQGVKVHKTLGSAAGLPRAESNTRFRASLDQCLRNLNVSHGLRVVMHALRVCQDVHCLSEYVSGRTSF